MNIYTAFCWNTAFSKLQLKLFATVKLNQSENIILAYLEGENDSSVWPGMYSYCSTFIYRLLYSHFYRWYSTTRWFSNHCHLILQSCLSNCCVFNGCPWNHHHHCLSTVQYYIQEQEVSCFHCFCCGLYNPSSLINTISLVIPLLCLVVFFFCLI